MTVFGQMRKYFGVDSAYTFLMFLLLEKEKKVSLCKFSFVCWQPCTALIHSYLAILLIGIKCTSYGSQFFNISLFSFIINLVYCLVQILIFLFYFLIFYCLVQTFGSYA